MKKILTKYINWEIGKERIGKIFKEECNSIIFERKPLFKKIKIELEEIKYFKGKEIFTINQYVSVEDEWIIDSKNIFMEIQKEKFIGVEYNAEDDDYGFKWIDSTYIFNLKQYEDVNGFNYLNHNDLKDFINYSIEDIEIKIKKKLKRIYEKGQEHNYLEYVNELIK